MVNRRMLVGAGALVAAFLVVQLGTLALVEPFRAAGYRAVENPSDPSNSLLYVGAILFATLFMLAAFRYGLDSLVRLFVVGSSAVLAFYVLSVLLPPVTVGGGAVPLPAAAVAGGLALALVVHPEWYVLDAVGLLVAMGAAGLFGSSFGLLPALVLLVVLAVYDAISVYGTGHMLTLASGVMDLKLPVVLVVPLTFDYSFLGEAPAVGGDGDAVAAGPAERGALFIGLGDAVVPTVLVASAAFFLPTGSLGVPGLALTLPALTAIAGTLVGLVVLVSFVARGRAHAGLPLLNGGAIAGYLVGTTLSGVSLVQALGLAPYV
jgi:presenilin-like A22 family membrane protease